MLRLGLCCTFYNEPIRFRRATATHLQKYERPRQLEMIAEICRSNAAALQQALDYCHRNGIGAFRVNSQILPLKTHPDVGYDMTQLPGGKKIIALFQACGQFAASKQIRTSFHPDQFIVLSTNRESVLDSALNELTYQAEIAEWIGADVINLHGGGAYGDKTSTLRRLAKRIARLPEAIRSRLTLENDDRVYTPQDLLPVCEAMQIPMVYDIHHHRCLPDGLTVSEVTRRALHTWHREPLFHISSPLDGWNGKDPRRHHDTIDPTDFPDEWLALDTPLTIEVEAKAKELAVLKLKEDLAKRS